MYCLCEIVFVVLRYRNLKNRNMENILNTIEKQLQKLQEKSSKIEFKIESRENVFNDKSEKWQESEKGESYQEETDRLQDVFDSMTEHIESIEFAIQELRELE